MPANANAIRLVFLSAALYIAALTTGLRLLYYLAYVMAALLVCAFLWAQLNKRGLLVRRQVEPGQAYIGQIIRETLEVENTSWLPKLWLEVRDRSTLPGHRVGAVITLKGRQPKRWQVRTRCLRRGLYRLGPTVVSTGDPFGLFQFGRVFEQTNELLVYPPMVPLSSFGLPASELPGGSQTERRAHYSTPNAAGIREYIPGDPMNRIHWPVSARAQKLMVKEFELDPTTDLWLVLDLQKDAHVDARDFDEDDEDVAREPQLFRNWQQQAHGTDGHSEPGRLLLDPTTEEYAIAVTASLASYFLGMGREVGLIAWGQHKVVLPADRGGRQLVKMLRALAVLRAEGSNSLGEVLTAEGRQFARRDTVVIVTPSLDEEWLAALQPHLYRGSRAAAVLVEPNTFGAEGNPLMLVSALTSVNVPTYLVKRDDAIDAALGQQYGPDAVRNLR